MSSDRADTDRPASASPDGGAPDFPDEHPTRPREYHGARTLVVALLVLLAVAIPLWLTLGDGAGPGRGGDLGPTDRPAYLLAPDLPDGALPPDDAIGRLAPDFELATLDGGRFRLSDWTGHPVVLNFWASWCAPCRREMPVLIRLQEQYRAAGLIVVGVNIEEARSPAGDFAAEFGINFALPMDFGGAVTRRYGIGGQLGPPHTMFLGPDGVIRTIFRGQAPDASFEAATADLVARLAAPVGPLPAPGPKALPVALLAAAGDEPRIEVRVGSLAPDLLLASADDRVLASADDPGRRWRLSDQRGRAVLLVFARPNCSQCDDELRRAVESAAAAGIEAAIIRTPSPPLATVAGYTSLVWERDGAALFGAGASVTYVLIDAAGVVEALPIDDAALSAALAGGNLTP